MAFKNCLFCNKLISELAELCPKCDNPNPFDAEKKAEKELLDSGRKKLEEFLKCKECGHKIKISDILKYYKSKECPNCGYPDIKILCFVCGIKAEFYDSYQKEFTCFNHLTDKCVYCGKHVLGINKKVERGGRIPLSLCGSCYNKNRSAEFWKDFPIAFILRPLGFGFIFCLLIGLSGFLVRTVLGHNLINSLFKAFSIEGFVGFFVGVIWAIVNRKELD